MDVNAKNEVGWTPLSLAAGFSGNPEVITTLIKAGADVNAKTMRRRTPLDHAESGRKPKNAELIRAAGRKRGEDLP